MLTSYLIFGIIALVAIATAIAMLVTRNPVFAVLFLVMNFIAVAVIYLLLGAPFIAFTQVTVYAGAIMVLFLFVIMMLGTEKMIFSEPLKGQRWLAGALALIFVIAVSAFLLSQLGNQPPMPAPAQGFGQPKDVGVLLLDNYTLPVLIVSLVILVATIGAVVLTRRVNNAQPEGSLPVANKPEDDKEGK